MHRNMGLSGKGHVGATMTPPAIGTRTDSKNQYRYRYKHDDSYCRDNELLVGHSFSPVVQFAVDALTILSWALLTTVTAAAVGASIFILLFVEV